MNCLMDWYIHSYSICSHFMFDEHKGEKYIGVLQVRGSKSEYVKCVLFASDHCP